MNPTKSRRAIAVCGLLVLLLLHFDFWRDRSGPAFVAGVPIEFAYRIGWIALAFVYLRWFTSAFWRENDAGGAG